MKWSSIAKFLLGSILGVAIVIGGGLAVGYYLLTRLAEPPPKPNFANDKPIAASPSPRDKQTSKQVTASNSTSTNLAATLEPGTYEARVAYPDGLSLRDSPGPNANRISGIEYNQRVVVLEESPDKQWQRVRLESGETEGWVKAGNVERVN